jgi:hypothetical protein
MRRSRSESGLLLSKKKEALLVIKLLLREFFRIPSRILGFLTCGK